MINVMHFTLFMLLLLMELVLNLKRSLKVVIACINRYDSVMIRLDMHQIQMDTKKSIDVREVPLHLHNTFRALHCS